MKEELTTFMDGGRLYVEAPWNPRRYISVARLVMEEHLGRPLASNEYVHHIDGDSLNDDLSNLKIVSPSEHTSLHFLGSTHVCSEETKEKIGKANTGKQRSQETKDLLSKIFTGCKNPHTEEWNEKISEARMGHGHPQSLETREKISKGMRESHERRRAELQTPST